MRHVSLTCKNHPDLRWSVKEIAVTVGPAGSPANYNQTRNIHFCGKVTNPLEFYDDKSGVRCSYGACECACPASDLVIAPEDAEIAKAFAEKYPNANPV